LDEPPPGGGPLAPRLLPNPLRTAPRRFNELVEALPGIAPNVLSKRLKHLERERVLVSQPYSRPPPRFADGLSALAERAADHAGAPDPEGPRHRACGTPLEARWYCPTCAHPVDDDDAGDLGFAWAAGPGG